MHEVSPISNPLEAVELLERVFSHEKVIIVISMIMARLPAGKVGPALCLELLSC